MSDEEREEVPFRSMKITLSEEAVDMLDTLRKRGAFRSYSMTIEECIRAIDAVTTDLAALWSIYSPPEKQFPSRVLMEAFRRYSMRLMRFLDKDLILKKKG